MNELMIRRLSSKELPLIADLLENQTNLFKLPKKPQTNEQYLSAINYRLLEESQHTIIYGAFLGNRLMAMAGGLFGKKTPVWTLSYVHTRKEGVHNFRKTTGKVIDALIEYAENKGIFRFEFVCALRQILTYNPQESSSRLTRISERSKRYNYYTEAHVAKNAKPEFEYHWLLLGQQLQEMDMLIRVGELKEEFRTNIVQKIYSAVGNNHHQ